MDSLKVMGNKLVDQYGRPRMLRGANIMDWEWKYSWRQTPEFELAAIPVLCGKPSQGWGANVVHFGVHSGPIMRNEPKYLNGLDSIVAACQAVNAWCLVCYRASEPDAGLPPNIDGNAVSAMGLLAQRYIGQHGLLWGAAVEPHDITWPALRPQIEKVIDRIRTFIPDAVVFCPGTQWSRYIHWCLTDPVQRDNVVYRVDYYDPFSAVDTNYKLAEVAQKYPVFLGEFGAGGQTSIEDTTKLLDYCELHGIGWCAWNFSDEGSPRLLRSKTTFEPNTFGTLLKPRLQEKYTDSYPLPPIEPPPPPPPVPTEHTYKITVAGMSLIFTTSIPITVEEVT